MSFQSAFIKSVFKNHRLQVQVNIIHQLNEKLIRDIKIQVKYADNNFIVYFHPHFSLNLFIEVFESICVKWKLYSSFFLVSWETLFIMNLRFLRLQIFSFKKVICITFADEVFEKPLPFIIGGIDTQWGQFASSVIIDGPNEFCGGSIVESNHVSKRWMKLNIFSKCSMPRFLPLPAACWTMNLKSLTQLGSK